MRKFLDILVFALIFPFLVLLYAIVCFIVGPYQQEKNNKGE